MLDSNTPAKPIVPTPGKTILSGSDVDTGATAKALLLGIDLGTSRTSVVSFNGTRKTVESYVGYPKDAVSRKFLKQDVVFGKAALDNRLALDLFRPLENGVIKGSEEASADPNRPREEPRRRQGSARPSRRPRQPGRDEMIYGVVGVPSRATHKNKQAILEITRQVLDSVMIVSEPFTVAYGMDKHGRYPGHRHRRRHHRPVPHARHRPRRRGRSQLHHRRRRDRRQAVRNMIKTKYPKAQLTQNMCKTFKEQYGFVSDTKDKIEVLIPVDGKPTPHDITVMKSAGLRDPRPADASKASSKAGRHLQPRIPGRSAQQHPPLRRRRPDARPQHPHRTQP